MPEIELRSVDPRLQGLPLIDLPPDATLGDLRLNVYRLDAFRFLHIQLPAIRLIYLGHVLTEPDSTLLSTLLPPFPAARAIVHVVLSTYYTQELAQANANAPRQNDPANAAGNPVQEPFFVSLWHKMKLSLFFGLLFFTFLLTGRFRSPRTKIICGFAAGLYFAVLVFDKPIQDWKERRRRQREENARRAPEERQRQRREMTAQRKLVLAVVAFFASLWPSFDVDRFLEVN